MRVQLSARFQEAVDRAAMRAGKGKSDAYIADWKRGEPRECGSDMKAEAIAEVARLEAHYTDADLERLIRAKGIAVPAEGEPKAEEEPRRDRRRSSDARRAALVGAPCARARDHLSPVRARPGGAGSAVATGRLRARRATRGGRGTHREGLPVRLPDVRAVRAELDRHVLPDELSQGAAQRALRRRTPRWPVRSGPADAMRLGRGDRRQRPDARRTLRGARGAIRGRPQARRPLVVARGRARKIGAAAGRGTQ